MNLSYSVYHYINYITNNRDGFQLAALRQVETTHAGVENCEDTI